MRLGIGELQLRKNVFFAGDAVADQNITFSGQSNITPAASLARQRGRKIIDRETVVSVSLSPNLEDIGIQQPNTTDAGGNATRK